MLPVRELTAWMDERGLGAGPISDEAILDGGTQNVLVRFRRGSDEYVFRRPPVAKRADSDRTMQREATVLTALAGSSVPHPRLIAAEADPSVIGAAFYLMEPVEGVTIPAGLADLDPPAKQRLGLAMVDGLAALARLDHVAVGLAGFGRPDGFLSRQVGRWRAQLDSYRQVAAWDGPGVDVERLGTWLDAHRPPTHPVGILHGDYHLSNAIFTTTGELAAIVDWELATIGDPLIDLAQLLVTWPDPAAGASFAGLVPVDQLDGFTAPGTIVERYRDMTGNDLTHLPWYRVLAAFRLGIIIEGTRVRALTGEAPPETGDALHDAAVRLLQGALDTVESA